MSRRVMGFVFALGLLLSGAGLNAADSGRPVITLAVPTGTAPFSAGSGSSLSGYDLDLLRSAGQVAQLEVKFRPVAGLEEGLELLRSREVDGVSGIALGLSAAGDTTLSPYRQSRYAAFVRKNALYRDTRDLAAARIAVPAQSAPWQYAKLRGWEVIAAESWADAFDQVETGKADAVIAEEGIARHYSVSLRQVPDEVFQAATGIAARPDATWRVDLENGLLTIDRTGHRAWLEGRWKLHEAPPRPGLQVNVFPLISGMLVFVAAVLILTAVPGTYRLLPRQTVNTASRPREGVKF